MKAVVRALADLSDLERRLSLGRTLTSRVALELEGRRATLRKEIPGNFLAAYDALATAGRRPPAVPLVRGAYCGGCYMRVPPQLDSSIRRGQSVCSCPHCRRLLYPGPPPEDSDGGQAPKRSRTRDARARSGKGSPAKR